MYISTLDSVVVGQVIAYFRQQSGMSQEVLSGLAGIGRSHLSAIEWGVRKPTLETFYCSCTAMNVKMTSVVRKLEEELEKEERRQPEKRTFR